MQIIHSVQFRKFWHTLRNAPSESRALLSLAWDSASEKDERLGNYMRMLCVEKLMSCGCVKPTANLESPAKQWAGLQTHTNEELF